MFEKSFMKNGNTAIVSFSAIVLFFGVWQVGVVLFQVDHWVLPSPSSIIQSLWSSRDLLFMHTIQTLGESVIGLFFSVVVGSGLAFLMEFFPLSKRSIYPFIIFSQTIPVIALAPLLIIWFGYGMLSKIILITMVCFFPIVISMIDGFAMVDPEWLRLVKTMGANRLQTFRLVKLPAVLPSFFSGFRIAGAYCVLGAVISEWLGAEKGLGIFLIRCAKSYMTERVFATIFVISILSLAVVCFIEVIAHVIMPWHFRKNLYQYTKTT